MPRGRALPELVVTEEQRQELVTLSRRRTVTQALALRARLILEFAKGRSVQDVGEQFDMRRGTAGKWRRRFIEFGIDGLYDEQRPGAPRKIGDDKIAAVLAKTLESKPKNATHWSTRTMADACGMSQSTVSRIWRAFRIQPHRTETFKLSSDPRFIEKVRDIVGLYMNPPDHALVLCVDEKSQIQALDRTRPTLPMRPGIPERRTHDYRRHGATTLFAALNAANGKVLGKCMQRHRAKEYQKFLDMIDKSTPPDVDLHLIIDNYSTHKTKKVQDWLARRPRFHIHYTPTSASWLNLVERWFGLLTQRQIRRGTHRSTHELEMAIYDFIEQSNSACKPFVWTKTADEILQTLAAYCAVISDSPH